jgi:hypothetical protein
MARSFLWPLLDHLQAGEQVSWVDITILRNHGLSEEEGAE